MTYIYKQILRQARPILSLEYMLEVKDQHPSRWEEWDEVRVYNQPRRISLGIS